MVWTDEYYSTHHALTCLPVDITPSTPSGSSPSGSPGRHVVVWQETASQHWHNIPPASSTTTSTSTAKSTDKGKDKGKDKAGDSGDGMPSSYDFTWTSSG